MRMMFTSPRLENVEGVAKLLNEAGVETRITGGRSYKGVSRRSFSYAEKNADKDPDPAVWVLKADHYKLARDVLHDAGLLEATRDEQANSYLPESFQFKDPTTVDPQKRITRIRIALLFIVGAMAGWMALRIMFHS